jgi:hypothetical protein
MAQPSSPQTEAEASALWLWPSVRASFATFGCEARRVFDSGAHTTRHDTKQSIGIEQVLWMVNETLSSPFSAWSKLVQVDNERFVRSASAGTQIEMARAQVAHLAQLVVRMTDLR